jgi:Ser/Thr protein kinase RdoA (MazF antagonist)
MIDAVKSPILTAYPFGRLSMVSAFEASFRNDNWLVADERGRRYVLRRNLQHAHAPRIAFQVRFQQHLRHHGFPTAEVVETRSGDFFALDDEGVPWVLCTYIELEGGRWSSTWRAGCTCSGARRAAPSASDRRSPAPSSTRMPAAAASAVRSAPRCR